MAQEKEIKEKRINIEGEEPQQQKAMAVRKSLRQRETMPTTT